MILLHTKEGEKINCGNFLVMHLKKIISFPSLKMVTMRSHLRGCQEQEGLRSPPYGDDSWMEIQMIRISHFKHQCRGSRQRRSRYVPSISLTPVFPFCLPHPGFVSSTPSHRNIFSYQTMETDIQFGVKKSFIRDALLSTGQPLTLLNRIHSVSAWTICTWVSPAMPRDTKGKWLDSWLWNAP